MSRTFRKILVCFIAVFAVSAVAASAASAAAPEFKPAKGTFPVKFTSTSGTSTLRGTGVAIVCTSDSNEGQITTAKTVTKLVVKFFGCKSGTSCKVHSKGNVNEEEIVTNELEGKLSPVAKAEAASEVGLDVFPDGKKGAYVTLEGTAECILTTQVTGSVIGEVKPTHVSQNTGEVIFLAKGTGLLKQKILKDVEEPEDTLKAFGVSVSEETTDMITYAGAEKVEVT
jgi:hypothetical protein